MRFLHRSRKFDDGTEDGEKKEIYFVLEYRKLSLLGGKLLTSFSFIIVEQVSGYNNEQSDVHHLYLS